MSAAVLCSQTNPHIVPALNIKRHVPRTIADLVESEFKHRSANACHTEH